MLSNLRLCFFLLLLASPVVPRRGGGFSGSRGSSASRGHVASGGHPSGGSNFHPQQNSFQQSHGNVHPQQSGGFRQQHNNFNQPRPNSFQPGVHQQPHFNSGSGLGSRGSSHTFAKALAGGAAGALGGLPFSLAVPEAYQGILIYEAGKAIIRSATEPYHHNGRPYYWDNNYQGNANQQQCSMPLSQLQQEAAKAEPSTTTTTTTTAAPAAEGESTTTVAPVTTTMSTAETLNTIQFKDGSRPKQIVWGCDKYREVCCGSDCCPNPNMGNNQQTNQSGGNSGKTSVTAILVFILLFILLAGCCCCLIAYKMCRSAFDCVLPRDEHKDNEYQSGYPEQQQQQGGYPMQQYPGQGPQQGYPPQQQGYPQGGNQYPNQGYPPQQAGYPNNYPSQPTY